MMYYGPLFLRPKPTHMYRGPTHMQLPSEYQNIIHRTRYARWLEDKGRRETWEETVDRYFDFFEAHLAGKHNTEAGEALRPVKQAVLNAKVMPSMRALMTAGEALKRDNIAGYNCAFRAYNDVDAFSEALYVLMCGTGVGFSVEKVHTEKLPSVPGHLSGLSHRGTIIVEDSKRGWAQAYKELVEALYSGYIPGWDMRKVRPAGARLKTFGGRASGPEPLDRLFKFTVDTFRGAVGRKLKPIEVHDIACMTGDIVVVGGVRRAALISLSDLDDEEMSVAKSGNWWEKTGHRRLANNSVAYSGKPTREVFDKEWESLKNSGSGERGIFNRQGAVDQVKSLNRRYWTDPIGRPYLFGTNPCSEIILRSAEFCNLSEVVCRADDTVSSLLQKVEYAAILGTIQSSLTDFNFVGEQWRENCQEERLLGVSMTGIMDCPLVDGSAGQASTSQLLTLLKQKAVEVNAEWASKLGIQASTAITCVKPSGTVSQLVDSASGIHTRYSDLYTRRIRMDIKDPVSLFMIDAGFPCEPDIMAPNDTVVFSFPMKAPEGAMTRNSRTAIEELEHWMLFQKAWCEHKPSVTINVRAHEWAEVGDWVYENFDMMTGVSFLPNDDHTYEQAPYEDVSQEEFDRLVSKMPKGVDWSMMAGYELEDNTTGSQELACTAGGCEIV